jgi:C-terminal processing protease CtpA/Prc
VEPRAVRRGDGRDDREADPYSAYTSPDEFAQFQQTMDGEFTGIGIMVDADPESRRLVVLDALVGKPAI